MAAKRAEAVSAAVTKLCPAAVDAEVVEYLSGTAAALFEEEDVNAEEVRAEFEEIVVPLLDGHGISEEDAAAFCEGVMQAAFGQEKKSANGKAARPSSSSTATATGTQANCLCRVPDLLLMYGGSPVPLLRNTTLELLRGHRYGVVGANGTGKTTLMARIAKKDIAGFPQDVTVVHLRHEAILKGVKPSISAKEYVELKNSGSTAASEADLAAALREVGFDGEEMLEKAVGALSGGWQMRLALACAVAQRAGLMLLDEPTNHLDLGACVWLEEYLAQYPTTICMTSHSEDFMNGVCTEIMQLTVDNKLVYWGGNYASYVKTRQEKEVNQLKAYEKEQDDIKHLQEFIRSCGTYSNLRKQAESKQKIIDKMVEKGLTEKPKSDPKYAFEFPNSEKLAPPVLAFNEVSFSYSGKKEDYLYKNTSFGVDLDSRIALVGPNGAGKSTLLKLMRAELDPVEGEIKRHNHLRLGIYHQHSAEVLPDDKTPLEFLMEKYDGGVVTTEGEKRLTIDQWRQKLGKYGITGDLQTRKIGTFSDGLKSRIIFVLISLTNPHILLLDEPTNHLDMTCIDALGAAINKFEGGLVLVSHDFRLIDQVAKEIWVCDKGVQPWKGDIKSYKAQLSKDMKKAAKARK
mmetsp:Transcript_20837/g.37985  ORF Transcript_20837/g.37985 Transcript_20837/m.37985 type:complete len:630 (-) Transcript_20837:40-1929(-)